MGTPSSGVPSGHLPGTAGRTLPPYPDQPAPELFGIPGGPEMADYPYNIPTRTWDEKYFPRPCILRPTTDTTAYLYVAPAQSRCPEISAYAPTSKLTKIAPGMAVIIPRPGIYNFYNAADVDRLFSVHDIGQFWDQWGAVMMAGYDPTVPDCPFPVRMTGGAIWVRDQNLAAGVNIANLVANGGSQLLKAGGAYARVFITNVGPAVAFISTLGAAATVNDIPIVQYGALEILPSAGMSNRGDFYCITAGGNASLRCEVWG